MKKIFIPDKLDEHITIPADITHHLLRVFRFESTKPLLVSGNDGQTGMYLIDADSVEQNEARASLIEYIQPKDSKQLEVVLVQAYLKNDKFEWILQKATELDVHTIYGVQTKNCVARYDDKKLRAKESRWHKILLEASQQCGRSQLPKLIVDANLKLILESEKESLCILASEDALKLSFKDVLSGLSVKRVVVFIGPEGSFSKDELELFRAYNIPFATLGNTILRAETAALTAVGMINYEYRL